MTRHPNMPNLRGSSPWGGIQHLKEYGPEACSVSTAGHGGFWIAPEAMARIPAPFRSTPYSGAGWFEEDCDWAIPFAFLDLHQFSSNPEADRASALRTLQHSHPDAFETLTGRKLAPGESTVRDEAAFYAEHAQSWIATSAWGDWAAWVPDGSVGVLALIGGRRAEAGLVAPGPRERWFLVPKAEYSARTGFGFIIDEARHVEVERPANPGANKQREA
jgi:hypothetical protein